MQVLQVKHLTELNEFSLLNYLLKKEEAQQLDQVVDLEIPKVMLKAWKLQSECLSSRKIKVGSNFQKERGSMKRLIVK